MTQDNNKPIKYFLYCRKSTDDERQVLSLESQKSEVSRKFPNLKITELPPESISAHNPYKRPIFNEMVERIKRGEAQGIVAWHPDRLSRNPIDAAQIIYLLDTGAIRDLKFSSYYFDNSPEGKMMLQITLSQSKYSSDKLSNDVKRGINKKAVMGWRPGHAPLGYLNTKTGIRGEQKIIKDPERFHLVKETLKLMLTGNYTVPRLLQVVNEDLGLRLRATRKKPERKLITSELYRLLTIPFYYGWYEWPTGSGNWIKGNHEPMITEQEYDHIQFLLGRKGRPRPKTHKFAFTGIVRCGSCNAMVTAEEKYKRQKNGNVHHYIYYHCTRKLNPDCPEKSIELKELNGQIDKILEGLSISERFQKWAIEFLHELRKTEASAREETVASRNKEYERITKQLDNLLLTYTSPENAKSELMTEKEYTGLRTRLLKQKGEIEAEFNAQGQEIEAWVELCERTFNFARYARTWFAQGDLETRRAIFACLGSDFFLKDQKVALTLQKPLQIIFERKDLVEKELEKLEPAKFGSLKGKLEDFASKFPVTSG